MMIAQLTRYFAPGEGGGEGGDGGSGGEPAGGDHWTAEHGYFQENPDAVKAFAKYKTPDDAFKGAHDLMKKLGKPYQLPEDVSKLPEPQQKEFRVALNKMHGVPEAPDGYNFEVPEGSPIDEQGINDFKTFAHENGIDPKTAQGLVNFQLSFVDRLNKARGKVIEGMTNANYKAFLNEDCDGDKDVAAVRLENVKKLLQGQFTKPDGTVDTQGWEKFAARIYHGDRIIELPILRALHEAAQQKFGTGGAPGDSYRQAAKSGAFSYKEMDR